MSCQCVSVSGTASAKPSLITWLASTKAPKHVLTKGLKLNFHKSFMTYLQEQIHMTNFLLMTNQTGMHACLISKNTCNKKFDKISHLHEQIRFAIENLLVCVGLWALKRRQASQYTK